MTMYGLPETVEFCRRCVMSNLRPASAVEYDHGPDSKKDTIAFKDGVCDACLVAEAKQHTDWKARHRELEALCDRHRSPYGHYDCIVPGSGGKDSFYAAHILKTRYRMHPLTVTWAPHLPTEWGWRNFLRWTAIADNVMVTPNREVHRLLTRLAVENLFHPFQPFIFGQKTIGPRMAARFGIPLVFYGESEAEYGNPKAEWHAATRSSAYWMKASQTVKLGGVSKADLIGRYRLTEGDLAMYLPLKPEEAEDIEVHYLGYYLKWRPQDCYYYAVEHGGFECCPERTPGTWSKYNSLDDQLDDFHYWTTYQKFGIGRATYDAAQEIRSGEITRDEGVALVKKYDGEWPTRFLAEVNEYLSVPGFPLMTTERWHTLARKFRPPHLWEGDQLRHRVWDSRTAYAPA